MPTLGDTIFSLCSKAGVFKDHAILKEMLTIPEIRDYQLPDEIAGPLEQRLMTAESAVANQDVRSRIYAESLNPIDSKLKQLVEDFQFDDGFKGEFETIKSSYEKIDKVAEGFKEQLKAAKEKVEQAQAAADGSVSSNTQLAAARKQVDLLQREVDKMNTDSQNLKRMHSEEVVALRNGLRDKEKEYALKTILASKRFPKDEIPQDVKIQTANFLIKKEMAKLGLDYTVNEAGETVLKQKREGGEIDYYDKDNKKIEFNDFIDGVLAQNKYIEVTPTFDQSSAQNRPGNNGFPQQNYPQLPVNRTVTKEIDEQLAQLGFQVGAVA